MAKIRNHMRKKRVTRSATFSSPFSPEVTTATHCFYVCLDKLFTPAHSDFHILKLILYVVLCSHGRPQFQVLFVCIPSLLSPPPRLAFYYAHPPPEEAPKPHP